MFRLISSSSGAEPCVFACGGARGIETEGYGTFTAEGAMIMKRFIDDDGSAWLATVERENTPRHHGRYYLVFQDEATGNRLVMPEVRWGTAASGERILRTMSDFELKRRLNIVRTRNASNDGPSADAGRIPRRGRTSVAAG